MFPPEGIEGESNDQRTAISQQSYSNPCDRDFEAAKTLLTMQSTAPSKAWNGEEDPVTGMPIFNTSSVQI